ncbi:hypothetical protein GE09DRAFT_1090729, partial [Coniochaeta sp. 2T2.1]
MPARVPLAFLIPSFSLCSAACQASFFPFTRFEGFVVCLPYPIQVAHWSFPEEGFKDSPCSASWRRVSPRA